MDFFEPLLREESLARALFTSSPGVGCGVVQKLVDAAGEVSLFFENPEKIDQFSIPGFSKEHRIELKKNVSRWNINSAREKLFSKKIGVISHADPEYPDSLKQIYSPPAVLFYRGDIEVLNNPCTAIVGTRRCDKFGVKIAGELAEKISELDITVVSGLAAGIDAAAHQGALGNSLTAAVLANGVDIVYPSRNRELQERISQAGVLVSEYPPGRTPERGHFPARNRIISGLSRAVVVVQAPARSGALITADFALEQGREVYAVPGNVTSSLHKGCHVLIKQGAGLVENVEDVIDYLQLSGNFTPESSRAKISSSAAQLLEFINDRPISLNELLETSGFDIGVCSRYLLELQDKKLILSLAGQRYQRSPDSRHIEVKIKQQD